MARIRIYISRHLTSAPRPQKEADALAALGHCVSVHGIAFRPDFAERDRTLAAGRAWTWEPAFDYSQPSNRAGWFLARLRHRLDKLWFRFTGRIRPNVWSVGAGDLARHARGNRADLVIVHSEAGVAFGAAMQERGARVGVDFEDWFSRDLAPHQRIDRPVAMLESLERRLLARCRYAITTSHSMAHAMADQFQTPEPGVIYNTFERASMPSISSPCGEVPRLHWFSLVIGPERGLEGLFQALGFVRGGWRLSLRGEGGSDYIGHLLNVLPEPQRSRVEVLPLVPTAELPRALAMHDIGFATEQAAIPSRNLTVTNKLFHYLHSGLIVLATPTDGQREVLGSFDGLSECVRFDRPREAALAIDRWLERRAGFGDLRKAVQARFRETFAWDTLLPVYSRHITGALEGEPACESS